MGVRRNQELMIAAHTAHAAAGVAHAQAATNKERVEWRMSEYIGKLGQQKVRLGSTRFKTIGPNMVQHPTYKDQLVLPC